MGANGRQEDTTATARTDHFPAVIARRPIESERGRQKGE